MHILISAPDPTELARQEWRFDIIERANALLVVLDSWRSEVRATRRHKFKTVVEYDRLRGRGSTAFGVTRVLEADVPLPDDPEPHDALARHNRNALARRR